MSARTHVSTAAAAHESRPGRDDAHLAAAADLLALLGDRTRLALLRRLGQGEADVGTLTACCQASRTSVSQHLARLRLAGLVAARRDGRRVIYGLRHGHLRRLVEEALHAADHQLRALPGHD
jgi:DNA-binding transcriptional ArsR family regulator